MKKSLRVPLLALYFCALFAAAGAQLRSLDGTRQFAVDREGKLTINDLSSVEDWREIQVPLSWKVQFADLRDYRGVAWYRKTVDLQQIKPDQTLLLKLGARRTRLSVSSPPKASSRSWLSNKALVRIRPQFAIP